MVCYLGKLHCAETTSGVGDDQFALEYGVLVSYDDGTYRAWADHLYTGSDMAKGFRQRDAKIGKPLLSMSQIAPNLPAALEVKKHNANIRFVRIALYAWERDSPFRINHTLDTRGRGLQLFDRGTDWAQGERWFWTDRVVTQLGTQLRDQTKYDSADDTIGHTEILLLPAELNRLMSWSSVVPRPEQLSSATALTDAGVAFARKPFSFGADGSRYTGELIFVHGLRETFGNTIPVPQQFRVEVQNGAGAPWRLIGVHSNRRQAEMAAAGERTRPTKTIRIVAVN